MNQLTFLLYILSRSVGSIKPALIQLLREWHEQFLCEPSSPFQPNQFCRALNLSVEQTQQFCKLFDTLSPAKLSEELTNSQVQSLSLFSDGYPTLLQECPDPPLVLYCRGNLKLLDNLAVAIVGSRRATKYGELAVQKIVAGLTAQPLVLISGLAYGIDAITHRAALVNNLPTIAVLGSGLADESIYPRENFQLAQNILESGGLLISEYPPSTAARKHQFIARNRIIAGLSQAVVIAEAAPKSGALITADFAMEYNRTVMAIPGSVLSPASTGPHQLISQGAALLQSSTELLQELNLDSTTQTTTQPQLALLTESEAGVLEYMQHEALELEELLILTKLPIHTLQAILANLELKQLIKQVSPQVFQKLLP